MRSLDSRWAHAKLASVFTGWRIVLVTSLTHFVSVGFIFYAYGAFFKALEADFGGSRLGVSIGLTVMQLVTGIFAPFLGRALDRGSIRNIMALGAVLMGAGFLLISQVSELWHFHFILGTILAVGAAMLGGLSGSTLVANWFIRRRGIALGIATMGISASGLVMAPVATQLIASYGWRLTFVLFAGVTLVVVLPIVWLTIVDRPEDLGLEPDGSEGVRDCAGSLEPLEPTLPLAPGGQIIDHAASFNWSARHTFRDANFWIISIAVALNFCAMGAILTHIIPHATDLGISSEAAAYVLSCMAGMGVIGKLLFGWLTDHGDKRVGFWLASGLQALGVGLVLNASGYSSLLVASAFFGLGMGGLIPLWGALIGAAFGRFAFGRVMTLMSPCMLPIQMLGVPFAGYVFDRWGSYDLAFETFIALYLIAIGVLGFLRLPAAEPGVV